VFFNLIYLGDEMKVNVLQMTEVKFKRWRWWSDWIDIAVFNYNVVPWLVQMKISRTNRKAFRVTSMIGLNTIRSATCSDIGDLTQMEKPR
jgi:hypothetical protein